MTVDIHDHVKQVFAEWKIEQLHESPETASMMKTPKQYSFSDLDLSMEIPKSNSGRYMYPKIEFTFEDVIETGNFHEYPVMATNPAKLFTL